MQIVILSKIAENSSSRSSDSGSESSAMRIRCGIMTEDKGPARERVRTSLIMFNIIQCSQVSRFCPPN
jgi:hypothetical protein